MSKASCERESESGHAPDARLASLQVSVRSPCPPQQTPSTPHTPPRFFALAAVDWLHRTQALAQNWLLVIRHSVAFAPCRRCSVRSDQPRSRAPSAALTAPSRAQTVRQGVQRSLTRKSTLSAATTVRCLLVPSLSRNHYKRTLLAKQGRCRLTVRTRQEGICCVLTFQGGEPQGRTVSDDSALAR